MKMNIAGCWVMLLVSQVMSDTQTSDGGTVSAKQNDMGNYVETTFYQTSQDQWKEIQDKTKEAIAEKATMYCREREKECGMTNQSEEAKANGTTDESHVFQGSDVKVKPGYPEKDRIYIKVPFAVKLPVNAVPKDGDNYLQKEPLKAILIESANDIKEKTGKVIRRVEDDEIPYPPNDTLNSAIIPVAIIILIAFIIAAIIVRIRLTKQDHKKVADEVALEKKKVPVRLVEMHKTESELPPASSSAADGDPTSSKDADNANVTESAALLDDKDASAVKV